MACSQDEIGWRRFTGEMIACRLVDIQCKFFAMHGTSWKLEKWLVVHLLEKTHSQWLYRIVILYDKVFRRLAIMHKKDIAAQIVEQLAR